MSSWVQSGVALPLPSPPAARLVLPPCCSIHLPAVWDCSPAAAPTCSPASSSSEACRAPSAPRTAAAGAGTAARPQGGAREGCQGRTGGRGVCGWWRTTVSVRQHQHQQGGSGDGRSKAAEELLLRPQRCRLVQPYRSTKLLVPDPCASLEGKGRAPVTGGPAEEDFRYLGINIVSGFQWSEDPKYT